MQDADIEVIFCTISVGNRTLRAQYLFVDISYRFALEISHKGFDSPPKAPLRHFLISTLLQYKNQPTEAGCFCGLWLDIIDA